jgi:ATP-dependent Lon protease
MPGKKSLDLLETNYPVIPLRDVVIYPYMVIPLFVGRETSIKSIEQAQKNKSGLFLVTQKDPNVDTPKKTDLYSVGCVATILQMLKLPDGTIKVLVEGVQRAKLVKLKKKPGGRLESEIELLGEPAHKAVDPEVTVLMKTAKSAFEEFVKQNKRIPPEILSPIETIVNPGRLADTIAAHLPVLIEKRQELLELSDPRKRLEQLIKAIEGEIDFIQVEKRVKGRVKRQMEKSQREYYLNEQIKAIQNELGELGDSPNEIEDLLKQIKESGMSKEAEEKSLSELNKLKMMPPMSAEATVCRNYLDTMLALPWKKTSRLSADLHKSQEILDNEHYGLEQIKERITEYLAVQQRVKKLKSPILCFVGPPGVGKTSLGSSIAKATGRKLVRMSLGGVRDEAEIRGHRRTYIGAMPGKILQKISKSETKNPFFLLDEIDKMAMDFRGDPASALLEVLDPEQNTAFNDHYLEVDYDLSEVMFVATANTMDIPPALLDRMEVINLSGYTEDEKVNIAVRHLLEKQLKANGLTEKEIGIDSNVIRSIIRFYTREAGVRSLERQISKICRKVVKEILLGEKKKKTKNSKTKTPVTKKINVTSDTMEKYLGVKRYRYGIAEEYNQIGQVTGLAWTSVGGELLTIEAAIVKGKGKAQYTGSLGTVMQESIQAALTVVRSRMDLLDISEDFFEKNNIHIHVPEGATPKDGPSAGVGMCTALVSVITGLPVKADVAMTGEITLRGEVLPIGGLKEKLLAAHRGNIKCVIIPEDNRKDLQEIPDNIKKDLVIKPVKWIDEVLSVALVGYLDLIRPKGKKAKYAEKTTTKKGKRGKTLTH